MHGVRCFFSVSFTMVMRERLVSLLPGLRYYIFKNGDHSIEESDLFRRSAALKSCSPQMRLLALMACAGVIVLAGCETDSPISRALKPLSPQLLAQLDQKHMPRSPRFSSDCSRRSQRSRSGNRTEAAALHCSRPIRSAAGRVSLAQRPGKATARRRRASTLSRPRR